MAVVETAHALVRDGMAVTPLSGKRPVMPNWTANPCRSGADVHTAFVEDHPQADGVGLVTGEASGVFVIDVDRLGALDELTASHGLDLRAMDTRTAATPRGGLHLFFRWAPGVTNATGALPAGIDVRGSGGQVVYRGWNDAPVLDAPAALLELMTSRRGPSGTGNASEDLRLTVRPDLAVLDSVANLAVGARTALGLSWEHLDVVAAWKGLADATVEHDGDPLALLPSGWPESFLTFLAGKLAGHRSSRTGGLIQALDALGVPPAQVAPETLRSPSAHLVEVPAIPPPKKGAEGEESESAATKLLRLANRGWLLGRSTDGQPFAIPRTGPRLARLLRSGDSLRSVLAAAYFLQHQRAAPSAAIADAMSTLEGISLRAEPSELHLRVARDGDDLWLDLGDTSGDAVRIRPGRDWEIRSDVPVSPLYSGGRTGRRPIE